jgi:hypothetical protein
VRMKKLKSQISVTKGGNRIIILHEVQVINQERKRWNKMNRQRVS